MVNRKSEEMRQILFLKNEAHRYDAFIGGFSRKPRWRGLNLELCWL